MCNTMILLTAREENSYEKLYESHVLQELCKVQHITPIKSRQDITTPESYDFDEWCCVCASKLNAARTILIILLP